MTKQRKNPEQSLARQPQQNKCDRCGAVFRSPEDLENHRVECQQRLEVGSRQP